MEIQSPADTSSTFAYFGNEISENPFPTFVKMRSAGPVVQVEIPTEEGTLTAWMVTQFAEAIQVLKDQKRFTVDAKLVGAEWFSERRARLEEDAPAFFGGRSMLSVDEPDHMRLRGLVSKVFTPKYIEGLRPRIQEIADDLLDRVQAQGTMDLVRDYAYPLPINVISEMLGVPLSDRGRIREWSKALVTGSFFKDNEERIASMKAFSDYTIDLISWKRSSPEDDLISQLIEIEESEDRLSEGELLSMVSLLIIAGHETTSNLIGIGSLMLLEHPEQCEKLKRDPSLIPSAVEELLRFNGPVLTPAMRFATEDIEIGGQTIKKGDPIMVALASANRDELQFADPDELEIARRLTATSPSDKVRTSALVLRLPALKGTWPLALCCTGCQIFVSMLHERPSPGTVVLH